MNPRYPRAPLITWDVDIDTTKAALERFARALIECDATMTCSMTIGGLPLGRGVSALTRVHIPDGNEAAFDRICRPILRKRPPRVAV